MYSILNLIMEILRTRSFNFYSFVWVQLMISTAVMRDERD